MANVNSPTLKMVQDAMRNADAACQETEIAVSAMADAIKALLVQPDSGHLRETIASLCDQIKYRVDETSNLINANAEELGCNHIDELARAASRRMYDAANGRASH